MARRQPIYVLVCLAVLLLTLWAGWKQPDILDDLRNFEFDTFQRLDPPPYNPTIPVRVVAIDEKSLAELGQWPWPRSRIEDLTTQLGRMGAAAIAFDIIFAEPDRASLENIVALMPDTPVKSDLLKDVAGQATNDMWFAKVLADAPSILGATLQQGAPVTWDPKAGFATAGDPPDRFVPQFPSAALPIPVLRDAAPGLGATNWLPDRDQIVRRVPLFLRAGSSLMPSLALETLRVGQGASTYVLRGSNSSGHTAFGAQTGLNAVRVGDMEIATSADGAIRPRYTRSNPARFVSAADLLAGRADPEAVRGRLVLVGTTAIGLGDVRATPLQAAVPGVEVHAQVLEQLLTGRLLSRPDWAQGAELILTLGLVAALGFVLPRIPPLLGSIITAWAVALLLIGAWLAFSRASLLLDGSVPALAVIAVYVAGASSLWQTEQRSKRQVRAAFGKFVAPAVVAKIAENPRLLVLSGETRELTILFSDLRNFSTISETLEAHEVARFLNDYLTPMTDIILERDGTVDKYIGDAIVAFWNAPLDVAEHTRRAVEASLAMRSALAELNRRQAARKSAEPRAVQNLRNGIGLNVGECSVGNMGSLQRFDYSALGDPVNLAARLEALTKSYGVDVLASQAVVDRTPTFAWLEVDEVKVKGRSAASSLFTLLGDEAFATGPEFAAWAAAHEKVLHAKRHARFAEANRAALALAETCPAPWRPFYEALAAKFATSREEVAIELEPAATTELIKPEWSI